ncbi:MAG: fibronectin type III domain-containing protein, partial [Candidatus Oxydemutatoraceae bacterium WSBS_2016_MAG_OTU14]
MDSDLFTHSIRTFTPDRVTEYRFFTGENNVHPPSPIEARVAITSLELENIQADQVTLTWVNDTANDPVTIGIYRDDLPLKEDPTVIALEPELINETGERRHTFENLNLIKGAPYRAFIYRSRYEEPEPLAAADDGTFVTTDGFVRRVGDGPQDYASALLGKAFSVAVTPPPLRLDAVQDLSLTNNAGNRITISWSAVEDAEVYRYEINKIPPSSMPEIASDFEISADAMPLAVQINTLDLDPQSEYYFHLLAGRLASRTSDSATSSFLFRTPFPRLSLRLEETTHENISIAWQELPNASAYQVTVYQGTGTNRFVLQGEIVTGSRFVLDSIIPGSEYTFEVSAQDSAGLFPSLTALFVAQTDGTILNRLPQANTDTLTRESKQAFVSWTPPLTTNVAGYRVILYQGSVSDELVREQALDATSTSYTFSELIPATEYTLRLIALSEGNNFSDSLPLDQSFTTTLLSPTSLELTRNDAQGPAFQWQSVTGAELYQYRLYPVAQDLVAQSPVEFSDTLLTSVSIDIGTLQGSTEYVFEVKAVNRDNLELSSNPPSSVRLNSLLALPQVIDQSITENS